MWSILKMLLGFLPGFSQWFNAREATKQAHEYGKASVGTAAAGALAVEADARQTSAQAYAAAGMRWAVFMILFPGFVAGSAAALHFAAVCFVSAFPGVRYVIHALPEPMATTQMYILSVIVGGGALLIGGMMYGRR